MQEHGDSRGLAAWLAGVCEAVAPGGRVAYARRLRGGLDAGMHAVGLVGPNGGRRQVVVRRYPRDETGAWRETAKRAWQMLGALEALGYPAPRPLLLDAEGSRFGRPTLVMSRLPGRGLLAPRNPLDWARQLGEQLAELHRAPLGRLDVGFLEGPRVFFERKLGEAMRRVSAEEHPFSAAARATLRRWSEHEEAGEAVLLHGDYWAGNTLWRRGKLVGVVDWDDAGLGPPGLDIGYCRLDLFTLAGAEAADVFLRAYQAAAGRQVPHLFFWDLLGAAMALPDPERWLPGYHDLGRTDITPEGMRSRTHAFVDRALANTP